MPYVAEKPPIAEPLEALRRRIPGWGVDLDPADRPSYPREVFDPGATGAHWHFPERQPEKRPRERSVEHEMLTPVFGTSCPPKGLSGIIRKLAYGRYSEGQSAHWLLLMAADRVDVVESRLGALAHGKPDNPIREMGLRGEITGHGIRSRMGQGRNDTKHLPIDVVMNAAPYLVAGGLALLIGRKLARR